MQKRGLLDWAEWIGEAGEGKGRRCSSRNLFLQAPRGQFDPSQYGGKRTPVILVEQSGQLSSLFSRCCLMCLFVSFCHDTIFSHSRKYLLTASDTGHSVTSAAV